MPRIATAASADEEASSSRVDDLIQRGRSQGHLSLSDLRTAFEQAGLTPGEARSILRELSEAGVRAVTTYGMSETCGGCVYDGVPLDGVTVRAGADGRLRISGPVLMNRYYGRPDLTAAALVAGSAGERREFVTSDLGTVDGGRVVVRGRADDVINTGGHKVVPGEVAAALSDCPGVREVVVVGRPDPEWGERVTAVVVPADPAEPPELELVRTHVSARLPRYACPSEVVLTEAIPLLPSGKPDLAALKGGKNVTPTGTNPGAER